MEQTFLVTGGAGFIGSAVIRHLLTHYPEARVVNVDALTYSANLDSLSSVEESPQYRFEHLDICDTSSLRSLLHEVRPTRIMHLAAESHVDRSIDGPAAFIRTNVFGTFVLLSEAQQYLRTLRMAEARNFRFLHVSTDEVFGSLGLSGKFTESTPYDPRSPYAATKASSDHLVRAWHHTYDFPSLISNCSNNYGPYQFPEKLIPLCILNALERKRIPVYGTGKNVRDWLYVEDHASALLRIIEHGRIGHTYLVGGHNERKNIEVVSAICDLVDEMSPDGAASRRTLIDFVVDRPGHDLRYAVDAQKIQADLQWRPAMDFETGLRRTVQWYVDHVDWWKRVRSGLYRGERLGLGEGTP